MAEKEFITIRTDIYEDMVFKYFKALNTISDLELEIFELQEELNTAVLENRD